MRPTDNNIYADIAQDVTEVTTDGVTRNTTPATPAPSIGLSCMKKDRPNYDVTWTINATVVIEIIRQPRRPHQPPKIDISAVKRSNALHLLRYENRQF